ncbi:SpoIIE family protein phosphatase [Microscilla marina]|uniref:Serine/threonine protein kinases, putative n=1 Tax=Microscilla marina ATCC 23134 TaxID=313606 RepID=A1ZYC3_MICM2|nr:SpoIIE family protein phosphatase [Microscilla marina]EAY24596.1 serine/threonine protein kinases, putative [Microscilla marina ATCC 23134]
MIQKIYLLLFTHFLCFTLTAQHSPLHAKLEGIPAIHNYSVNEYNADVFNHAITQDNRGLIYVANNAGVLEYDGSHWRLIKLPNKSRVYSLAIDKTQNRVYVGGVGEFGYLTPNQQGKTVFKSLLKRIPKAHRHFTQVWSTHVTPQHQVIFRTHTAIFILSADQAAVYQPSPQHTFHVSFYVNQQFYVRERGTGLMKMSGNKLALIPAGDFFAKKTVYAMLPYDAQNLLIVSRSGMYLYDGKKLTLWKNELHEYLSSYRVYYCKPFKKDYYIINTLRKGLFIIDKKGKIHQHIDQEHGLINSSVYHSFVDKDKNIWVASNQGLSHIVASSGFTFYNQILGLNSHLSASAYVNDQLYVGTMQGGLFGETEVSAQHQFRVRPQLSKINHLNNILDLYAHEYTLLVGHQNGIWAYNTQQKKGREITQEQGHFVRKFMPFIHQKDKVLVSTRKGLMTVFEQNKEWKALEIKGLNQSIPYVAEYKERHLLASNDNGRLSKVVLNVGLDSIVNTKRYDTIQGLPAMHGNRVFKINNEVVIATHRGIYQYNEASDKFVPHPHFSELNHCWISYIQTDAQGNLWLWASDQSSVMEVMFLQKKAQSNTYQVVKKPFKKLKKNFMVLGSHINPVDHKNVLFSAPEGAVHYSHDVNRKYDQPYFCIIRKVESISDKDSLLFGGTFVDKQGAVTVQQAHKKLPRLHYDDHNLRFSFSATYYEDHDQLEYSFYLKGFESHWHPWTNNTEKEYTNIPEGTYTFYVKARNIYGTESLVASYSFKIRPPWNRTVWAYAGMVLLGGLLVWGIVKLNVRRLQMQKRKLEKVVELRTAEVLEKNEALSQQKEEITIQAESLKTQKEELEVLNESISEKNRVIEKKNRDIVASINYARRIQSAMLPPMEEITHSLPETFILYRPRDIVSGDFYWFAEVERASLGTPSSDTIIIAADCTGHGVPGAFVSMVGNELLNEIVKMRGIHKPSLILDWLHDGIKRVFHQKETKSRDGMDITVCTINQDQKLLQFAGAQNPLLYVKNGEMTIIKGDKRSIGGNATKDNAGYTNHEVALDVPVTFYLFSDGYQDQFGGPRGKKFMTRKFHQLLHEISSQPLAKQGEMLDQALTEWMGDIEQIDDILVLGARV